MKICKLDCYLGCLSVEQELVYSFTVFRDAENAFDLRGEKDKMINNLYMVSLLIIENYFILFCKDYTAPILKERLKNLFII